jgi:hypothetical protein
MKCKKASARVDDKGYPFGIECLKYNDCIDIQQAKKEKQFEQTLHLL